MYDGDDDYCCDGDDGDDVVMVMVMVMGWDQPHSAATGYGQGTLLSLATNNAAATTYLASAVQI
jgi:hypothetical protein